MQYPPTKPFKPLVANRLPSYSLRETTLSVKNVIYLLHRWIPLSFTPPKQDLLVKLPLTTWLANSHYRLVAFKRKELDDLRLRLYKMNQVKLPMKLIPLEQKERRNIWFWTLTWLSDCPHSTWNSWFSMLSGAMIGVLTRVLGIYFSYKRECKWELFQFSRKH